jgi:galactose mutarotase-like enzyme
MYAALFRRRLAELRHNAWQTMVKRTGLLITVTVTVVLLLVAVALKERHRGHLTKLKAELGVSHTVPHQAVAIRPGGQDPVVLEHPQVTDTDSPQFVSATLLPGRGMNLLQIKAHLPQMGTIDLLASPSLDDAAKQMTGEGEDADGSTSLTMGGAIEAPWAGRIWSEASNGATTWRGHTLALPASGEVSAGGLLLDRPADTVKTTVMPDGGQAQAIYNAGDFDGHWISHTQITTTVQLNSRALEISIAARNTGTEAEPIGIGWHPRFAIPSRDRRQATLKLPNALHAETDDHRDGMSTGRLLPVAGTPYDFTGHDGARLGNLDLNDGFVQLKQGLLDNGPIAELRDPRSNFGLRITMLSPAIKAIHVTAPANASFISIDPRFNHDDPFGHEWAKGEDTGMVVLEPGQTVQWKIRLEIFALNGDTSQPM